MDKIYTFGFFTAFFGVAGFAFALAGDLAALATGFFFTAFFGDLPGEFEALDCAALFTLTLVFEAVVFLSVLEAGFFLSVLEAGFLSTFAAAFSFLALAFASSACLILFSLNLPV